MSVIGDFFNKTAVHGVRKRQAGGTVTVGPSLAAAAGAGPLAGPLVTSETALRFTAVFAAIRLRSENIASLPKSVARVGANGRVTERNHPASLVIRERPNGYMNAFTFWEYLNSCLDGWGNAYALIERDGRGYPSALYPVHPRSVSTQLREGRKYFRVTDTNFPGVYEDGEMCHFFMLSRDGITGINPISYNADAIGLGMSATEYGKTFFASGGNVKAVIEAPGPVDNDAYGKLKKQVRDNHGTLILEYDMKYKAVGIAPEAAQMLETKLFSIQDVARIFNVPPHLLAELSKANYSTIEQQNIQFGMYSLRPTVKRYEVELERKLFVEGEGLDVKFDLRGLMRGDAASRSQYLHTMVQDGIISRNEARRSEHYEPVEGLDEFMVPLNMGIVGKDGRIKPVDETNETND